ncbi:MAG TPA: hypothetical protein VGQ83_32055 [Polyangia bacterium]
MTESSESQGPAVDAPTPAPAETPSMTRYAAQLTRARDGWDALPKCTRCLLPSQFRFIEYDAQGVCNYCHAHHEVIEETRDPQMRRQLDQIIAEHCPADGDYDCVVAYSGGKDSTYVLNLMSRLYGLRTLALTIDTGFLPEAAKRNVALGVAKLGVDHTWVRAGARVHDLYRFAFRKDAPHGTEFAVCGYCGEILRRVLAETAIARRVPLIVAGFDQFQLIDWDIYSMPALGKDCCWKPDLREQGLFGDLFQIANFDPQGFIPTEVFPFMYVPYHKALVIKASRDAGIIEETAVDETNCRLTYLMEAMDLLKRGVPAFAFLHSSDIRHGLCSPQEATRQIKKLYDDYASGAEDGRLFEALGVLGLRLEDLGGA